MARREIDPLLTVGAVLTEKNRLDHIREALPLRATAPLKRDKSTILTVVNDQAQTDTHNQ